MIRRHVTPALLCFIVLLGCVALGAVAPGAWPLSLAGSAGLGAVAIVLASTGRLRAGVLLGALCFGLLMGSTSLARMAAATARAFLPVPGSDVSSFSAVVTQDSTLSKKGMTVVRVDLADVTSGRAGLTGQAHGAALLFVSGDYRFALGERLRVAGPLTPLPGPGAERFSAFISRPAIRSLGYSAGFWRARAQAREWLHRSLSRTGYPVSALMEALLIGSREDVPAELSDAFLRTGSLHILALSGLHVTILYGVIALFLRFLRGRWLKFFIASALLLFYQVLAGFMPSLLRATVMIIAGGVGLCADRDAEPLNALALAGIILILIDPWQAQTVSFQLSFLAMAGIFAVAPLVEAPLKGRVPRVVLVPLAMSVGAQAATLPLIMTAFGAWYPSGLAAGLLLVPLTTVLLWAGLAWIPVSLLPFPAVLDAGARVLSVLYTVIERVAAFFALIPGIVFGPGALAWCPALVVAALAGMALLLPRARQAGRAHA